MRKYHIALSVIVILLFLSVAVFAHSGRTDSKGGHNSSTGYHYHHGYPAHDHYDINGDGMKDCPYNFDDKTGHSSGNTGNSSGSSANNPQSDVDHSHKITTSEQSSSVFHPLLWIVIGGSAIWLLCFGLNKARRSKKTIARNQFHTQIAAKTSPPSIISTAVTSPSRHNAVSLNSSFLMSAEYLEQVLYLTFKDGRRYAYYQVPQNVYRELINAQSPGKYFLENILDIYPVM